MASSLKSLTALVISFILLAGTVSILLPLDEVPDENSHFDLIRFIAEQQRLPQNNQERQAIGNKGDAAPFYHGLVALLTQHVDISPLSERHRISPSHQFIPFDTILTTRKLHTEDELPPFRGIVLAWHLARFVSVFLSAFTLIAIYLTVDLIYPQRPYFALAVTGMAVFVPRFVINSAVLNDDNLVIPLITFALYYLVRVIQGDIRLRTLLILGILIGSAVLAKYSASILMLELTVIFMILAQQSDDGWWIWLKRWALVGLAFALTTGWWFYLLFSQFNQVAELGWVQGSLAPLGDPTTTNMPNLWAATISWDWVVPVFRSFWLVAGALLVYGPDYIYESLTVLTIIAGLGLLRSAYLHSTQRPFWRLEILLLALHLLFYLGIIFGRYQIFVAENGDPPPFSTQGRHLYPALISVAFFYVLGWYSILLTLADLFKWSNHSWLERGLAFTITTGFFAFSLVAFFLVVRPIYFPFLPITLRQPEAVSITNRTNITYQDGLHFVGYNLKPVMPDGYRLPIELYWMARNSYNRDYIAGLCLRAHLGETATCHWGHPADGLYPTRAWDPDYLIRDERAIPLPQCLDPAQYELTLSILPLSNNDASAVPEFTRFPPETFSLGSTFVSPADVQANTKLQLCTNDACYQEGLILLKQMRQGVTLISQVTQVEAHHAEATYYFQWNDEPTVTWQAIQDSGIYQCPADQLFRTQTFLVDETLARGTYTLMINDQPYEKLSVQIATRPRNFNPPQVQSSQNISFADQFILAGYDLDLSARYPQQPITVTSYWQGQARMSSNYNVAIHLLDNTQTSQAFADHPVGALYPNVLWAPGEFVQDKQILEPIVPLLPGLYHLELRLYDHSQGQFQSLPMIDLSTKEPSETHPTLGQLRIMDPARISPPTHLVTATLNDEILFRGFDLASSNVTAGDVLALRLYWEAVSQPNTNYTVFTQLIGPVGIVAQQDNQPQNGRFPTGTWSLNDVVVDNYEIVIPAETPPGTYQLFIGMYDFATGERLPTVDERDHRLSNDAILLHKIEITSNS